MKKLRRRFLLLLTVFIVIVGFGSWLILIHFIPSLAFYDYPLIPLFFYTVGIVSIYILTGLKIDKPNKLLNTFMLIRGIKMFLAIVMATTYWLLDRAEIRSFAIMLVAFYLCYLFLETYIYIKIETWNKKNLPSMYKKKDHDEEV
jgi:predicted neutral ceramidase superfamily lipid hydrolase